MRYFLVDHENVGSSGIKGLKNLSKRDKIVVLYSRNADTFKIDTMLELINTIKEKEIDIKFYEIPMVGPNALDFNLSAIVGGIICRAKTKNVEIIIISKDGGYDALLKGAPIIFDEQISKKKTTYSFERVPCLYAYLLDDFIKKTELMEALASDGIKSQYSVIKTAIINEITKHSCTDINTSFSRICNEILYASEALGKRTLGVAKPHIKKILELLHHDYKYH